MVIKAISFDLWGTILHDKTLTTHKVLSDYICKELGEHYFVNMFVKTINEKQFLKDFERITGKPKMLIAKAMLKKQSKNYKIYPDVKYIFALAKKYKLAIISNASFRTRIIVDNWKDSKYFNPIVISYEVENDKPSKKIFTYTTGKLKIKTTELLHVGNDIDDDFKGPKKQGINTLLLDRNNEHKEIKERITSFKGLEKYLEQLL